MESSSQYQGALSKIKSDFLKFFILLGRQKDSFSLNFNSGIFSKSGLIISSLSFIIAHLSLSLWAKNISPYPFKSIKFLYLKSILILFFKSIRPNFLFFATIKVLLLKW